MRIRETKGEAGLPTVIFVHGAGVAGWMWKPQLDGLGGEGRWRFVTVDLADHGLDRDRPFLGMEAESDALSEIVEAEAGGKAWLVGHSLGAKIVLELLCRKPALAAGAVISSALLRPSPLVTLMDSHALNVASLWMLRSRAVARLQASQFAFPDPAMTEAFIAELGAMKVGNLDRPIHAFASRLCLPEGLDRITCPVLVTAGSREPASMRGSAEELARQVPGARLAVIEGARHNYPWTHAGEYDSLLRSFLP